MIFKTVIFNSIFIKINILLLCFSLANNFNFTETLRDFDQKKKIEINI